MLDLENEVANLNGYGGGVEPFEILLKLSSWREAVRICARTGIPEDPVTGAIHCSLIPLAEEKETFTRDSSPEAANYQELNGDRVKIE